MPQQSQRFIVFAPFRIDLQRSALSRGEDVMPLRRQSFDVLRYLAERSGRTVPSEDIVAAIWPTRPAYPDASLAQCIKDIRKALGDHQWMIRTVSGVGYELTPIATLSSEGGGEPSAARAMPTRSVATGRPQAEPAQGTWGRVRALLARLPRTRQAAIAGAGLAALLLPAWLALRPPDRANPAPLLMMASPSVTVLPASGEGNAAGGALAFADQVAAELRRVPRGFDITIHLSNGLAGHPAVRQVASRYAVLTTLSEEAGSRQTLVQLLEAPTGVQVWARPFAQPGTDVEARERLAARVARELAVEIRRIEGQRPMPRRPEAGHYALSARLLLESERGKEVNARAMALFDKGVALNPDHVQSLQGSARTRVAAVGNGWSPAADRQRVLDEAQLAVDRIISLDKASVGGHLLRGVIERTKGNLERSLASLEHARSLNPSYALVHGEIGRILIDLGRPGEAIDNIRRALDLSPTDPVASAWYYWAGMAEAVRGDFQASLDWLMKSAQANPRFDGIRPWIAIAYGRLGQTERARELVGDHVAAQPGFSSAGWIRHHARGRAEVAARLAPLGEELARLGAPAVRQGNK